MVSRHAIDRQLGLGLETFEQSRPDEQLPTLCDLLVVDCLPGTHPGVTKCLDAALKLDDVINGSKQWACYKASGCALHASYDHRHCSLYLVAQVDTSCLPPPSQLYLEPCCPPWLTALQPNARATQWHAAAAAELIGNLRRNVDEVVMGRRLQRVILIGWSDGGALAQLLATYIPLAITCSADLRCITFDACRVMNLELVRGYEQLVPCSYNVLSGSDPLFDSFLCPNGLEVALMPRRPFGYVRHGRDPSFTWFPVNTPLLLSKSALRCTTLRHPWGEPQPMATFIEALKARSSVKCDLWAWLVALQDAAVPEQKLHKLQSRLSMAKDGALNFAMPYAPDADAIRHEEEEQGTSKKATEWESLQQQQGPEPQSNGQQTGGLQAQKMMTVAGQTGSGGSQSAGDTRHGCVDETTAAFGDTTGSGGTSQEGDQHTGAVGGGLTSKTVLAAVESTAAPAAEAGGAEPPDSPGSCTVQPLSVTEANTDSTRHGAHDEVLAERTRNSTSSDTASQVPKTEALSPVGAARLAQTISRSANKLAAKLEGLSTKLVEQQATAVAETGLPPGDAMKMERQVRGLEAQLRRQHTLESNVCDGDLDLDTGSPSSLDTRPESQPSALRPAPTARIGGRSGSAKRLSVVQEDSGHVSQLATEEQTDDIQETTLVEVRLSDAALSDAELQGPHDPSLLCKVLLCSRVHPCLVASSAVYYQYNSFPSYTGIEETAWVHDPVFNTNAYLGWIASSGMLIIAFRGTATWQDVLQDLKQAQQGQAFLYPWLSRVSVHTGFLQQLLGALGLHKDTQQQPAATPTSATVPADHDDAATPIPAAATSKAAASNAAVGKSSATALAPSAASYTPVTRRTGRAAASSTANSQLGSRLSPNFTALPDHSARDRLSDVHSTRGHTAAPSAFSASASTPDAQQRAATSAAESIQQDDTLLHAAARLTGGAAHVRCVVCTGHSLGGAVACLAAPLLACAYPNADVRCVTFGCPRVGNRHFACYYKSLVGFSARVVAGQDPITNMPTGQEPDYKMHHVYHHVPHMIHVDGKGFVDSHAWAPVTLPRGFVPQHHLLRYYFHFMKPLAQTGGRALWGIPELQPQTLTPVDIEGDLLTEAAAKAAAVSSPKATTLAALRKQVEGAAWVQQLQSRQGFSTLKQWWGGGRKTDAAG